jgi:hypothetical protein
MLWFSGDSTTIAALSGVGPLAPGAGVGMGTTGPLGEVVELRVEPSVELRVGAAVGGGTIPVWVSS